MNAGEIRALAQAHGRVLAEHAASVGSVPMDALLASVIPAVFEATAQLADLNEKFERMMEREDRRGRYTHG